MKRDWLKRGKKQTEKFRFGVWLALLGPLIHSLNTGYPTSCSTITCPVEDFDQACTICVQQRTKKKYLSFTLSSPLPLYLPLVITSFLWKTIMTLIIINTSTGEKEIGTREGDARGGAGSPTASPNAHTETKG